MFWFVTFFREKSLLGNIIFNFSEKIINILKHYLAGLKNKILKYLVKEIPKFSIHFKSF